MRALVFGYGQTADGSIDAQTRDRCLTAVKLYLLREISVIHLTVSASKNGVRMGDAMRDFFTSHGISSSKIVSDLRGGNTAGELRVFLDEADVRFDLGRGESVILISTWYHIPRIVWLASWRLPWNQFEVRTAWRHVRFKGDILVEFLKIAKAVLRPRSSAKVLQPR